MSDHSKNKGGVGGRGIIIGLLLIAVLVAGLAFLGGGGADVAPDGTVIEPQTPDGAPAVTE